MRSGVSSIHASGDRQEPSPGGSLVQGGAGGFDSPTEGQAERSAGTGIAERVPLQGILLQLGMG
jgi:hypothetical protein